MSGESPGPSPRADIFGLLAELLSFPGRDLGKAVRDGRVRGAVQHLLDHQPYTVNVRFDGLACEAADHEIEAEYIRLFDVPDGTPTPLYTGVYARQRREAMEELLRFYRHFGLTLASNAHDLPDFVPTVLEFLRFLSLRAEAVDGEAREATLLAQADVIDRHLLPWAMQTAGRISTRAPHPLYADTLKLCLQVATGELGWLRSEVGLAERAG